MKHRYWRTALALILVLVLLISWSPIRAQASVLGGIASGALLFGDDAIAIILAVLGGLGVCAIAGSETSDLETRALARSAMDAMEEAGTFVENGALSVYTSVTEAWSYAVSTDLVQWLHEWLYDSGVVSYNEQYVQNFPTSEAVRKAYQEAMSYPYHLVFAPLSGTNWILVGSDSPIKVLSSDSNGTIIKIGDYGGYTYHCDPSGKVTAIYRDSGNLHIAGILGSAVQPEITTTTQANLGVVAPPGTNIRTEYGQYVVEIDLNGRPETGGDGGDGGDEEQPKKNVIPVPYLPPSEIPNVPQEDIWKGNKVEIENPDPGTGTDPDPGTGTDPDPGTGTDPDPGSGTDPDPGSGSNPDPGTSIKPWQDWLTPNGDPGQYGIQLRDFFPFCIPFDLYDFLSCLAADPVAPVFHWEIPVPQLGRTFEIDVDLSAWDPVAELFRRLELLAFIVGLAYVTREKYLRG